MTATYWQSVAKALATLSTVFLAIVIRRRYFSSISHIPGPVLASITRLWHVREVLRGKQNYKLVELHDKYGHFVRISHDEVSISHPAGVKALYLASIPKGDWYRVFVFPDWRSPAAIAIQDPKYKAEWMKYMSNAGFLLHNVLQYESIMDENMIKLMGWLDRYAEQNKGMDLDKFFTYVAFDITGEVTFSKPFGFLEKGEDVGKAIANNMGLQMFLTTIGFYIWISYLVNNPLVSWLGILPVGHIINTSKAAIDERRKDPDAKFDMCSHWFKGLKKAENEKYPDFNERHLLSAAVANLGAGSDTVSCGLQTFVYHLSRQPERWQRLREEIESARKEGRCHDTIISYEDASKLPYLEASIKESLRILAPVPMGLPRVAPKGGITIGDMSFPEGTTLSINPTVVHLSKEIWGPDAREFHPDRWLEPDIASRDKYFMPWGLGWTSCPGQHLARVQMSKILATIVRDYDIRLVHPEKEWKWAAYFTLNPHDWPVYEEKHQKTGC